MKIKDFVKLNLEKLKKISNTPLLDLEIIISQSLNRKKEWLILNKDYSLKPKELKNINKNLEKRLNLMPIAYIFKTKNFYDSNFYVDQSVLIPRPETELMVDLVTTSLASDVAEPIGKALIWEIGTGSGCIIVSVLKKLLKNQDFNYNAYDFWASDLSLKALKVAKKNYRNIILKNQKLKQTKAKINFFKSDLLGNPVASTTLSHLEGFKKYKEIIITANLPYVKQEDYWKYYDNLQYEPKTALIAEDKGLKLIKKLIKQAFELKAKVNSKIILYLEIDPDQKTELQEFLAELDKKSLIKLRFFKDLSDKIRVLKVNL
jgi:release factor glutamine methyltransferase